MAYYKTTIAIEVLSDGPYEFVGLEQLEYDITQGPCSGKVNAIKSVQLTEEQLIRACDEHHTDPGFFLDLEEEIEGNK